MKGGEKEVRMVISLGGNALSPVKGKGSFQKLVKNVQKVCHAILPIVKKNEAVIVCGSGPQIGFLVVQNELAQKQVPPLPLDVLDAELQGEVGYLIEQSLENEFEKHRVRKSVVSVLTQVIVDKNDPGFKHPTKPIGSAYTEKQARMLKKRGISLVYQEGRGYRRVVASPKPVKIDGVKMIDALLKKQSIVIAAGGGGIPVIKEKGKLKGVAAVIDKDLASAQLGIDIQAEQLIIITEVDNVFLNFGKKNQMPLHKMTVKDAKKYQKEGQFPPGSMGPKIEAAIMFLEKGGKKVVITSPVKVPMAVKGKAGTMLV